jgi:hypothetical protein
MHFVFGLITTAFAKPVCPSALGAEKRGRVDGERSDIGGNGGKWKAGKLQSTGMGKNTSALMLLFATRARKKGFGAPFLILFMRMCVVFSSR